MDDPLDRALAAVRRLAPQRVVVFTGAGVSADSGIPTFRGAGGLRREFRAEDLATPAAFERDPRQVWEWYEWRRELIRDAAPNAAHDAIARLTGAVVVTQNVDGLHARAGARNILELHGNIFRTRCTREGTTHDALEPFAELPPHCACGALLRPDVVWFGEMLDDDIVARASTAIAACDLLVVIGTSGAVTPAAGLVALSCGITIEINPEATRHSSNCDFAIAATAAQATPALINAILEVRNA